MFATLIDRANGLLKRVPVLPLYFLALVPGLWLFWRAVAGQLGPDPMKTLEHGLGLWALKFMIATLIVTPLMRWPGLRLLRFRRMLGLTAFYYAVAHFIVYIALDQQFGWSFILADIFKRPYIMFGMAAFVLMIPLAATSTDGAVRRLGALAWRNLHMLVYPAAVLMVLHYLWLVKRWTGEPLAYAAIIALLLALRLVPKRRKQQRAGSNSLTPARSQG